MKKQIYTLTLLGFLSLPAFSQVQIDRPIDLNSTTPGNARIMGIKEVSAPQDAVSAEKLQSGSLIYAASAGTPTTYTLTLAPVLGTYTTGMEIRFKAHTANAAGPVTLNVNALGAKTIKKDVGTDLAANDIKLDQLVTVAYDGTNFQLISRITDANSGGTVTSVSGTAPIVSSGGNTPAISITAATGSAAGSMSAADKTKLDAITGTNTGDQTITLTGDVTGSGTGSFATAIGTGKVTNAHILDGTIVNADIANSTINLTTKVTGILPLANGGTSANLSATGGAGQVLKQVSAGGAVTVAALTTSDIPATISGAWTRTSPNVTLVTSTDNVGIGFTPNVKLHVVAAGASDQVVARFSQSNTTNGNTTLIGLGTENAAWSKGAIGFQRTSSYDVGDITFNLNSNAASGTDVTEADERMRITSAGIFSLSNNNTTAFPPYNGSGGGAISWNRSAGSGEVDIWNNVSAGSPRGFSFRQMTSASASTELLRLEGDNGGIFGKFRHSTNHSFNVPSYRSGTNFSHVFPAEGAEGTDDSGGDLGRAQTSVAPYAGRLVKVIVVADGTSSNGGNEISNATIFLSVNQTDYSTPTPTYVGSTLYSINEGGSFTFYPPTNWTFSAGNRIRVGLRFTGTSGYVEDNDYFVTCVWEYNIQD